MVKCKVCADTHVVGTFRNGQTTYEPCRACMRELGYDVEKDPKEFYHVNHKTWMKELGGPCFALSDDPDTQNYAMIVQGNNIVAAEANYIPIQLQKTEERKTRPNKYNYIEHAERAAIYRCIKNGINTSGTTMYCSWACCPDCARAIILAGIKLVVTSKERNRTTPARWKDKVKLGLSMLKEAGVEVKMI